VCAAAALDSPPFPPRLLPRRVRPTGRRILPEVIYPKSTKLFVDNPPDSNYDNLRRKTISALRLADSIPWRSASLKRLNLSELS
jgi:hypothetical protein